MHQTYTRCEPQRGESTAQLVARRVESCWLANADRKKEPPKTKKNMRSVRDLMGFAPAVHQNNALSKDPQVINAFSSFFGGGAPGEPCLSMPFSLNIMVETNCLFCPTRGWVCEPSLAAFDAYIPLLVQGVPSVRPTLWYQALVRHWVDDREHAAAAISNKGITREAYDIVKIVGGDRHTGRISVPDMMAKLQRAKGRGSGSLPPTATAHSKPWKLISPWGSTGRPNPKP